MTTLLNTETAQPSMQLFQIKGQSARETAAHWASSGPAVRGSNTASPPALQTLNPRRVAYTDGSMPWAGLQRRQRVNTTKKEYRPPK